MDTSLHYVRWPYYALRQPGIGGAKKQVVFFGADFYNMTEINVPAFIERTNQCLDYVRKQCAGYDLIYRPHPDEKEELKMLDLASFSIQRDDVPAEEFLWKNQGDIRYVFAVCSTSSIAGYQMGLNSYSFFPYFEGVFKGVHKIFVEKYFEGLPKEFFIADLSRPLSDNAVPLHPDSEFEKSLTQTLSDHPGPIWFIVVENRFMLAIRALAQMIKQISPSRPVNIVVAKHHRWTGEVLEDLKKTFNEVVVFPRHFYSLEPGKLLSAFRTARTIKKLPLGPQAIIMGFAHHSFIENCFISYKKDAHTLAFLPEKTWEITFKPEESGFPKEGLFPTKVGMFYKRFFEPLLGLNPTSFRQYTGESRLSFIRLVRPLEDIYDKVFLFKNSPAENIDQ